MSSRLLTDAELAAALRASTPRSAPSGSSDRLAVALRATRQRRTFPFPLAALVDADPAARRSALLAAAAVLLAVAVAVAGAVAVGALRLWPSPKQDLSLVPPSRATFAPPLDLSLDPPRDLQAYMVSVTQDSPIVRPMVFTVLDDRHQNGSGEVMDGPSKARVYLDGSGAVRIERFASTDSTEPASFTITTGERRVELTRQGAERVWVEELGAMEPRIWVFLETAAYIGVADRGCEMSGLDPSAGWEYVGLEEILGRPAHHVRCDGDFWIDVETRLILRSRNSDPSPRTIEVTSLELGPQPAALFDTTRPDSIRTVTRDEQREYETREYEARLCAADPVCSAPQAPLVTPAPAAGATPPHDVAGIVARALSAREAAPPLHLTVNRWRSRGGEAGQDRLDYVDPNRFRVDWGPDAVARSPGRTGIAASDEEIYESQTAEDGTVTWRRRHQNPFNFYVTDWFGDLLIGLPDDCPSWHHRGVDTVGTFTADHLECNGAEYWIDRATHLVVRRQAVDESRCGRAEWPWPCTGTAVSEVVELSFGPSPDDRFRLPDGAALEPEPTPDPNFVPTEPPQPAGG